MSKKVLLDTNFLVECVRFRIDLFSEIDRLLPSFKLFILDRSLEELNYIKIKDRNLIDLFIKKFEIVKTKDFSSEYSVDDILTELSKDYIVATQDKELKKRLKGNKIIIRQKRYLELK